MGRGHLFREDSCVLPQGQARPLPQGRGTGPVPVHSRLRAQAPGKNTSWIPYHPAFTGQPVPGPELKVRSAPEKFCHTQTQPGAHKAPEAKMLEGHAPGQTSLALHQSNEDAHHHRGRHAGRAWKVADKEGMILFEVHQSTHCLQWRFFHLPIPDDFLCARKTAQATPLVVMHSGHQPAQLKKSGCMQTGPKHRGSKHIDKDRRSRTCSARELTGRRAGAHRHTGARVCQSGTGACTGPSEDEQVHSPAMRAGLRFRTKDCPVL